MSDIKLTFKALFFVGTLVLLLGFILVWIPESSISNLKEQQNQATLISAKAGLERVISAENLNLLTFYQPISNVLKAIGVIVIAYSILATSFDIALTNRSKKMLFSTSSNFVEKKPYPMRTKIDTFVLEKNMKQETSLDKPFFTSSLDIDFKKPIS